MNQRQCDYVARCEWQCVLHIKIAMLTGTLHVLVGMPGNDCQCSHPPPDVGSLTACLLLRHGCTETIMLSAPPGTRNASQSGDHCSLLYQRVPAQVLPQRTSFVRSLSRVCVVTRCFDFAKTTLVRLFSDPGLRRR